MTPFARRLQELRLAGMLLTRVPMGTLREPIPSLPDARWAYPVIGLGLGLVMALFASGATFLGFHPGITALLVVAIGVLLTGAMHEDGMADLADGLGGGRDKKHRLEIMRDSRIGSYGVLALGLTLALKAQAMLAVFAAGDVLWPLLAMMAASRGCMLLVQETLPPARSDGMGHSAHERGGWRPLVGCAIALASVLTLGTQGFIVLTAMLCAALALRYQAKRLIGGQTGDVLGAVQLAAECAGWLALSLLL